MKKTIVILLALVLCFSALAGCSKVTPNEIQSPVSEPVMATEPDEEDALGFSGVPYSQESIVGLWRCTLEEADYSPEIFGYLRFGDDGSVAFDYGDGYGPAGMGMVMYRGTWYIDPDMGSSNLPDPLILNLSLDCAMFAGNKDQFPSEINSTYTFIVEDEQLFLSFVDGNNLYNSGEELMWEYDFERDDSPQDAFAKLWGMSDTELAAYLKANSLKAAKYLASGMNAIATGGYTELPNGEIGRNVGLGTKQRDYYEYDILYIISTGGDVYQEDNISHNASLTVAEAKEIVQAWLDNHSDMYGFDLSKYSYDMFEYNGDEFFRFYYNQMYWLDFLVNSNTGELLCRQTEDGEHARDPVIEPLDDYYERTY